MLRTVAALIHVAARLATLSAGSALNDFKRVTSLNPIYIRLNANPRLPRLTTGLTDPVGPNMRLGSNMSVAGIVHELGHAFDRTRGEYSLSKPLGEKGDLLSELYMTKTGVPQANGTTIYVGYKEYDFMQPYPNDLVSMLSKSGMKGRARDLEGDPVTKTNRWRSFP